MKEKKIANFLGWFSIGLGVTEIVAGKQLARALGMPNRGALLRFYGVREIVAGIGLLTQTKKGPWIWARIAGDVVDVATLGAALFTRNPKRGNVALAAAAVAPIVALDVYDGARLGVSA